MNFEKAADVLQETAQSLEGYHEGSLPTQEQLNSALDLVWREVLRAPSFLGNLLLRFNATKIEDSRKILKNLQSQITSGNIGSCQALSPADLDALDITIRTFNAVDAHIQEAGIDDYPYLGSDELRQMSSAIQAAIYLLRTISEVLDR